ncbi:phospholipid/cholesterol/gamma-HCH transport system substrate-binding protein [Pedobacter sp. UYP30]|uniref:MlaD family protein n=1 Tax=Pedobacter sp. UYP30 TaxID=1756400 RepID=UPI0033945AE1
MAKTGGNNIKLGLFVMAGLLLLIASFYMIGKSSNLFGKDFEIKARFNNLSGLMVGNNVLFSGLQAGTVKKIDMIGDTVIEVTMQINSKVRPYISKNAQAAIGTEGLMGNKVINIEPAKQPGKKVSEGDMLPAQKLVSTDEMLKTLSKTNDDVAAIANALKQTVLRLDTSEIFNLMNDPQIGLSVKSSLNELNMATKNANQMSYSLNTLVGQIRRGKGAAGVLLTDTLLASNLKHAVADFSATGSNAKNITSKLGTTVNGIDYQLNNGKGPLHALLRDSSITKKLGSSLENLQNGTKGFSDIMDATKHSFLFRGYFRRQDKLKKNNEKE